MLVIEIPGFGTLRLEHLVLDYNGTLARDGMLIDGVAQRLQRLANELAIHVLTADTFGRARAALEGLPCRLEILGLASQDEAKLAYVEKLGRERTACIGNGRNDRMMLEAAALGIAVVQAEGAAAQTLAVSDVVVAHVHEALDLLLCPGRLVATLRS
ncbi:MAG TPA: HAD hydrolase family protein [Burkholderiales bacterium]|nr:HAD hydrolase family protein [Burkholderiales bacterium]